jgi:diphthamide biosynthesis methyltransferase
MCKIPRHIQKHTSNSRIVNNFVLTRNRMSKVISLSFTTENYKNNHFVPRNRDNLYHNKRTINFTDIPQSKAHVY